VIKLVLLAIQPQLVASMTYQAIHSFLVLITDN